MMARGMEYLRRRRRKRQRVVGRWEAACMAQESSHRAQENKPHNRPTQKEVSLEVCWEPQPSVPEVTTGTRLSACQNTRAHPQNIV